jgi:hypothetical protein
MQPWACLVFDSLVENTINLYEPGAFVRGIFLYLLENWFVQFSVTNVDPCIIKNTFHRNDAWVLLNALDSWEEIPSSLLVPRVPLAGQDML